MLDSALDIDPALVRPSRHTLYLRGLRPNIRPDEVRRFFVDHGHNCTVVFSINKQGLLNVALRFDSHDEASQLLRRYNDGRKPVLGCRLNIVWFKDLQAAKERVRNDPELRRRLEERGALPASAYPSSSGSGQFSSSMAKRLGGGDVGSGWQQQQQRRDSYDNYDRNDDDRPASVAASLKSSSRSSRSRSVQSGRGSESRSKRRPVPPSAPLHRQKSPTSPVTANHRSQSGSRSPSGSRSRSPVGQRINPAGASTPPRPATPPAASSLTAGELVRRRKADIESMYRQDCDTFATVVKMLLRHDPGLDGPLQAALKAALRDIGNQSVQELRDYIRSIRSTTDSTVSEALPDVKQADTTDA